MDITYSRTHDRKFIHTCMTSPAVWRMSFNDSLGKVNPDLFFIKKDWPFYYLRVDPDMGGLIGDPKGNKEYEVHIALLPEAKGYAVEICRGAIDWFFENEDVDCLSTAIPSFNPLSMRLAKMVGMMSTGTRHGAFLQHGRAYDLHLFEIRR